MQPLDLGLNAAVMSIASRLFPLGFDVSADAPSTTEELRAHLDAGNRMVVYSSGSNATIYADREVNWCFRAWHDWCHWRGRHDLSFDSECAVARLQTGHVRVLYGEGTARRWQPIIHAEVIGQARYYQIHKRFPENQYGFVRAYVQDKRNALLWPLW